MLELSERPLVERYDLLMLDLDGVVYVGDRAVPGAADNIARARRAGAHIAFITNNASRAPQAVVDRLAGLGVEAAASDVVTSAQAAATLLLERHGAGAVVAVLGADGLREALAEAGLRAGRVDEPAAVGLVSGFGPDVVWHEVMRAAMRIRDGLPWVASNTDRTFPTPDGIAPGHGALVELLSDFSGVVPVVAGKPRRPLLDETVRRVGGDRPLMVGDRLDTDIEAAHEAEVDSLLVMTGVTGLGELAAAGPGSRPTYVAASLAGLCEPHPRPAEGPHGWSLAGWAARVDQGRLRVDGDGGLDDWWRVAAVAAWAHRDTTGEVPDIRGVLPPRGPLDR